MKRTNFFLFIILLSIFFASCDDIKNQQTVQPKVKYVFFFIGDGMGEGHVALTESYLEAINDSIGFEKLSFSDFPTIGFQKTYAENRLITGSAASGTALATGHKTSIATISMASNHIDTLYSVAYYAKKAGYNVGILTSVGINHATPAVFYAHQPKRNEYYEIATQMPNSNVDVFGGGGIISPTGRYNDTVNAYDLVTNAGYQYVHSISDFNNLQPSDNKVFMCSPITLSSAEMPYSIDQTTGMLTLADFTQKAIELLDNPNGFFMMVEGGKIDWAAHNNDAATVIHEVVDFSNAVQKAIDFYNLHPDETLIIVTADHETGGLAIGYDSLHYDTHLELLKNQKTSIEVFSNVIKKYADSISLSNLSINDVLTLGNQYFGIDSVNKYELEELTNSLNKFKSSTNSVTTQYAGLNPIAVAWVNIIDCRAGVAWTTHSHTATPVPVRAIGVNHNLFDGFYENTDIPKKIAKCMKLGNVL